MGNAQWLEQLLSIPQSTPYERPAEAGVHLGPLIKSKKSPKIFFAKPLDKLKEVE